MAEVAETIDVTVYDTSYIELAATLDGRASTPDEALLAAAADTEYDDHLTHIADFH